MIIERKMQVNVKKLKKQISDLQSSKDFESFSQQSTEIAELIGMLQVYGSAMKEVSTKLEILDDEFYVSHSHNPIHHLESRVKSIESINQKVKKYNISNDIQTIRDNIYDIAGIRVLCNFIDDIYMVEKLLLSQEDIKLITRKDYIEKPKENGYRSLHIVVKVPVFLSNRVAKVPVEVQIRTVAMDYWASLEHSLRYKNDKISMEKYAAKLLECSNTLADTEKIMQEIHNSIM